MDAGDRFKVLVEQLATVLRVQEVTARVLKNKPSHVLLVKFKKSLARETKKLLLLEREIHLSRSVNGNWESNSSEFFDESFELIGSVLKKVTLIEKEIDEKVEGSPIDSNSEENIVHNSSDEGNYSSQPKYDFSIVNGAGVTHVQDYKSHTVNLVSPYSALQGKVETQFLDYQEGKPFLPGTDFVVDFPSKRAATPEVFSSQHVSPIILPFDSTRALFDRGKYKLKFVSKLRFPYCFGFQFFDRLCSESVQKLVSDIGYQSDGFPSDSIACMLANDGFTTTVGFMFDKMLECAVMRRLIDRGKQFAVVPRLYFVTHMLHITFLLDISSIAENTRLTFDRGREFYDGSVSVNTYHTDFICTLILGLKCGFKWVFTDSNVFEIVQDTDDYCDNELNVKISQATSLFRSISTSLWFSMAESEMNWEFSDRMHNYRRCCFSGDIVSIRIQLGYCSRKIPYSVTRSWNSEEGLYCGLECTGRVFDQGRFLGMTPQSCHEYCNQFLVEIAKLMLMAILRCDVFKLHEGVMAKLGSGQNGFPDTLEVNLLCQRFTNHSHEIRNTLQDKDNSTQGFQYGIVFHSYTHSLASCRHWLGLHSGSEYFGRIQVDRVADDRASQAVEHSIWSFLSTSDLAQYLISCCNHVGALTSHSTRYLLPCYSYLWGWVYEATGSYSWSRILARLVRTQDLLMAIEILNVIMLPEFLRLKFKLLSINLRTTRNCSGLIWVVIVLLGLHSSTVCGSGKWSFSWVETHGQGEYLEEFLFLSQSYSCVSSNLCATMLQQGILPWAKLKIHILIRTAYVIAQEMLDKWLAKEINFVAQMGQVQVDIVARTSNSSQQLLNSTSMRVGVWKIFVTELRYLQVFLVSVPTVVKSHTYLSEIGFLHILLLTPEVSGSYSFHEGVTMTMVCFPWSCFYLPGRAQHQKSGYNQLIGVYKCASTLYSPLFYKSMWEIACQIEENCSCIDCVLVRTVGINKMLVNANGRGLNWVFFTILGLSNLIVCGSSVCSFNRYGTHLLLQLQNVVYVKMLASGRHVYFCYVEGFKQRFSDIQRHPFVLLMLEYEKEIVLTSHTRRGHAQYKQSVKQEKLQEVSKKVVGGFTQQNKAFLNCAFISGHTCADALRCLPCCSQLFGFLFRHKVPDKGVEFCEWTAEGVTNEMLSTSTLHNPFMLIVIHFPTVFIMVVSLRWKLFSPSLWSAGNDSWDIATRMAVKCAQKQDTLSQNFQFIVLQWNKGAVEHAKILRRQLWQVEFMALQNQKLEMSPSSKEVDLLNKIWEREVFCARRQPEDSWSRFNWK